MTVSEERRALVALAMVPGLGPGRIRRLVARFGSARRVLAADRRLLSVVEGIGEKTVRNIVDFDGFDLVDAQFRDAERAGARLVLEADAEFPALLREIFDPPPFLWMRGHMMESDHHPIAMVGTRRASSYGRHLATRLATGLVEHGLTVVSGLAYGIDTAAHEGALGANGRTIGVLGSGIDRVYPSRNKRLACRMADSGCILSEYAVGTKPEAPNFPRRNRIISGMSLGTVVIEAFEEGGALITARLACEQNREVFAVPSPISHPGGPGSGCNRLIQRGHAKLVMSIDDILEELPDHLTPRNDPGHSVDGFSPRPDLLSREESLLWDVLEFHPTHLDTICSKTELDASTVLVHLLNLEFRGLIRQLAGKHFVRS